MNRPPFGRRSPAGVLLGGLCLDLGGASPETVLFCGSARSGTTWTSRHLARTLRARYIFEPLHPGRVRASRHLEPGTYLRPGQSHPEYLKPVSRALGGHLRSRWSDRYNERLVARRRLVKEVRANLMLGWLRERFPEVPAVLLLRHPCAVVESRARLGWPDRLGVLAEQESLVRDHLRPFGRLIDRALEEADPFERGLLVWCVENYVPLRQVPGPGAAPLRVLRYEDVLLDPERTLADLTRDLLPDTEERARCAATDTPDLRSLEHREELAFGWRERVPARRRRRAGELLAAFGLDALYGEEGPVPLKGVADLQEATSARGPR